MKNRKKNTENRQDTNSKQTEKKLENTQKIKRTNRDQTENRWKQACTRLQTENGTENRQKRDRKWNRFLI